MDERSIQVLPVLHRCDSCAAARLVAVVLLAVLPVSLRLACAAKLEAIVAEVVVSTMMS